mgnify:CR=1 FL=1
MRGGCICTTMLAVMGPAHVCNVLDEAVKTAIARRTVAHITIPKDIQDWSANGHDHFLPGLSVLSAAC